MVHRRARLTPLGRLVVVERVLVEGWPAARVAEAASVSRPTVYKWVRRFLEEGIEGLNDRSSAPHRRPRALPAEAIVEIVAARRRLKQGPHRLGYALGRPRSSIYGVLRRHDLARLDHLDRPSGRPIRRYEWARPGGSSTSTSRSSVGSHPAVGGGCAGEVHGAGRTANAGSATTTCTSRSTITVVSPSSRFIPTSERTPSWGSWLEPAARSRSGECVSSG